MVPGRIIFFPYNLRGLNWNWLPIFRNEPWLNLASSPANHTYQGNAKQAYLNAGTWEISPVPFSEYITVTKKGVGLLEIFHHVGLEAGEERKHLCKENQIIMVCLCHLRPHYDSRRLFWISKLATFLLSYYHGLSEINLIYCQSNKSRIMKHKNQALKHLPLTLPFFPGST